MGKYLSQMIQSLDEPDRRTKIILNLIAVIFIVHYLIDIFFYIFPYIYLYGLRRNFWDGYPLLQQFLLTYQSLTRFMKGIIMALVVIAIVKGTEIKTSHDTPGNHTINDEDGEDDLLATDINVDRDELEQINGFLRKESKII